MEILKVLGHQSPENQSFISEEQFISYIEQLHEAQPFANGSFDEVFDHVSKEMRDLLKSMLEFNPHFRVTAR